MAVALVFRRYVGSLRFETRLITRHTHRVKRRFVCRRLPVAGRFLWSPHRTHNPWWNGK